MKVAIAKVFRMSSSELKRKCVELINKRSEMIDGDHDQIIEELSECIGENLALLYPLPYYPDYEEMLRELTMTEEEIRLVLKHFGGLLIVDSLYGISEESIMQAFDDCLEETFVQFLR